jgi:hypothetical protein
MTTRTLTDTATVTQDVSVDGVVGLNIPAGATLTTPNIGVATATSVNKLTITAPANGSTLQIMDGKTFTCVNTLLLFGVDGRAFILGDNSGTGSTAICEYSQSSGPLTTAIGYSCLASAEGAVGVGAGASAIGVKATSVGYYASAAGPSSAAAGHSAETKAVTRHARATGDPKTQRYEHMLSKQTTDATPTVLTADGGAASAANQNTLANNSCQSFRGRVIGFTSDSAAACGFEFSGLIRRTADAASTALVSAVTPVAIGTPDAALATATVAVTADTTNGALAVTVTGVAATTINWTCVIDSELRAT